MQYVMCDVWCKMCDVPDLIFCKIWTLWVKGRPKTPHLSNFRPFYWYSKIDPRWQSYAHNILQGLLRTICKILLGQDGPIKSELDHFEPGKKYLKSFGLQFWKWWLENHSSLNRPVISPIHWNSCDLKCGTPGFASTIATLLFSHWNSCVSICLYLTRPGARPGRLATLHSELQGPRV